MFKKEKLDEKKRSRKEIFLIWLLPMIVTGFLRFIGLLSKRHNINKDHFDELFNNKKPFILGIWHTNVLCSPYLNRNQNTAVLISASRDGNYITNVVHRLGNTSIRGSTSRRSIGALKSIIEYLKKGNSVAITPDGPRGTCSDSSAWHCYFSSGESGTYYSLSL